MTRSRNMLINEFSSQVTRLGRDSQVGQPLGIGTRSSAGSLFALEEIAMLAGRKANAKRQAALAEWAASPYYDLRQAYSGSKGVVGELLTRALFEQAFGLEVKDAYTEVDGVTRPASRYDEMIARLGTNDTKLATRGDNGHFLWSSINPSDETYAMLWGVSPDMIRGWLVPTKDLTQLLAAKKAGAAVTGISMSQHGEFSINVKCDNVPAWLAPFGGDEAALRARVELELDK